MRPNLLLLAMVLAAALTAFAQTGVPILNAKFDLDQLPCVATCSYAGLTGWITGPGTGVYLASTAQYPNAPPNGIAVAYLGSGCATCSSGSILQTLGATLQANTTYILKVLVGARADVAFTGYKAGLLAGNVTLASGDHAKPVGGTFVEEVIGYKSGATPAQLGQPLQILIRSLGTGQANIAGVTLTVE